jgi:F0F1-type ATP synthase membrane subunit c/vacuolar-type H+-ATPase subunit K
MELTLGLGLAALGAGLAMGVSAIGAGIGVGIAGAAGAGIIAEDAKKFGPVLILQAFPQTQGIFGFVTAVLILMGVGLLGDEPKPISTELGLICLGAGLSSALGGLTAIGQGITAGAAMGAVAKNPATLGQGMVLSVMSETFAVFALLIAILILVGAGVMGV